MCSRKTSNKKVLFFIYMSLMFLSLPFLGAFSFDSTGKEELLNNAIFENDERSSKSDFSYSIKVNSIKQELVLTANKQNRIFYNDRNTVSIIEDFNYSIYDKKVLFSNSSKLETVEGFTTNHLLFSTISDKKIVDLDFFEDTEKESVGEDNAMSVGVIIPYSLSLNIAYEEQISFEQLMYENISNYISINDYRYYVAGIWDDQITSASYYNYNSFYSELDGYVIFVNNKYSFSTDDSSAYLLMGNNRIKNLDFLHSCKNSNGRSLDFGVPRLTINNFYINGMLLPDYFNYLVQHYHSFQTVSISVASGIIFIVLFVAIIFFLSRYKYKLIDNRFFSKTIFFIPLLSVIFASLIVSWISKIKINSLPLVSISSTGMLLLCIMNLVISSILFLVFRRDKHSNPSTKLKSSFSRKVAIVSFCDLKDINASTIRIKSIINMIEKAGKQWIHIGYSESNDSSNTDIGIKRFSNKFLNFIFAPFLFVLSLRKVKNQIDLLYIYSPLPIVSSIFVNYFASFCHIEVVHDVCEFQNISEINIKRPGWFYMANTFYNRFIIGFNDKVIPITTYLEKYFKSKGAKTLLVPPVFDENDIETITKEKNNGLTFTYIGFPGKKDNLKMCIDGFRLFFLAHPDMVGKIKINLYGSLEYFANYVAGFREEDIKQSFHFFGKCSRDKLPKIYEQTSYLFFIRNPKKRFSKAGFPSKVVESLFYSTPIFTNRTSDLSLYLNDPSNVIWIDNYSSDSVSHSIDRILKYHKDSLYLNDCRQLAVKRFSTNVYTNDFINFLYPKEKRITEVANELVHYFEVDI